jgi:hypothetical protein
MSIIGKYCIARCRDGGAGIHYGVVREVAGTVVLLDSSKGYGEPECRGPRRLWRWTEHFTLHGVALHGPGTNCKLSEAAPTVVYLSEVCELIPVTEEARVLLERGP